MTNFLKNFIDFWKGNTEVSTSSTPKPRYRVRNIQRGCPFSLSRNVSSLPMAEYFTKGKWIEIGRNADIIYDRETPLTQIEKHKKLVEKLEQWQNIKSDYYIISAHINHTRIEIFYDVNLFNKSTPELGWNVEPVKHNVFEYLEYAERWVKHQEEMMNKEKIITYYE